MQGEELCSGEPRNKWLGGPKALIEPIISVEHGVKANQLETLSTDIGLRFDHMPLTCWVCVMSIIYYGWIY